MIRHTALTLLAALLAAGASFAQPPEPLPLPLPKQPPPKPDAVPPMPLPLPPPVALKAPKSPVQPKPGEAEAIGKLLRDLALKNMPEPLVKANDGWGKQKEFVAGPVMLRNPKRFSPEAPRVLVNDGLWRRFSVTARKPDETLAVGITEMTRPELNTTLATVNVAMDVNFRMEQQLWKRGIQLYSGETRGHCKSAVKLNAIVVNKSETKPGALLPEVTLTIKVTDAKLFYDDVVIDHTAGLDGQDAQAVGNLVIDLVKAIKPDLEKQLLEKANAAILKELASKDIKVQLDKLLLPPVNGAKKQK